MEKLQTKMVIDMISESLEEKVTLETTMNDSNNWDSLGHLKIMSDLDAEFDNKLGSIRELATATSVKNIVDILKNNSLIQ